MSRRRANVLVVVQAREGSSRFPKKVLAPLMGQPMLWHVLDRVCASRTVRSQDLPPIVAIPWTDETLRARLQKALASKRAWWITPRRPLRIVQGASTDVLDRLYQAAISVTQLTGRSVGAVVRVTGDCPLLDPFLLDEAVRLWRETKVDLVEAVLPRWPDGLDVQVIGMSALGIAWREATLPADREHVTPYLNRSGFKCLLVPTPQRPAVAPEFATMKWSVDTRADLARVRTILQHLRRMTPRGPYHHAATWSASQEGL